MLEEPVIKRLTLSRYLFQIAIQNAQSDQEVAGAACVNLLQDAIEIFLLAALDHLNVRVAARTDFPQYLDKINEATNDELPFRRRLLEINKVRVAAKHDGIPPNRKEIQGYVSDAGKFLEQACRKVLDVDFWSVSLTRLLSDNEGKELLLESEKQFDRGDYQECLTSCRKAFYLEFESEYDIRKDEEAVIFGSRAPYYARQKGWAAENVQTPFDYIVLDHGQIDADLTKEGVDHTTYWNIWRMTPAVYRHKKEDAWLVKHEFNLFEEEGIKERAAYVLENIVTILLARQANQKMMKWVRSSVRYVLPLRKEKTTVYSKADRTSAVAGTTIEGIKEIEVEYATPGLKGDGQYWYVFQFEAKPFFSGFIPEEDLIIDQ
jgi:hypothetical protein